jgi:Ca-activated chloride channel homolog
LQAIAKTCEGLFFKATDNQALTKIFNQIDGFEKSPMKEMKYSQKQDLYTVYLPWAMVFIIVWLGLKSTFMSNVLED